MQLPQNSNNKLKNKSYQKKFDNKVNKNQFHKYKKDKGFDKKFSNKPKSANSMKLNENAKKSLQKVVPREYCCIFRVSWKKNNIFINITNLRGKTIFKMSTGFIEKRKVKKELRKMLNFMLSNTSYFVQANFDSMHIFVKGSSLKSVLPIYNILRFKETPITGLKVCSPVLHNGCRPPKKRRI